MTTRRLLYATQNPGKFAEIRTLMGAYGLPVTAPHEIGLMLDVDEHGSTLEQNAALKALAYRAALDDDITIVIGDDTGIEIDALGGEPGIHVRRWDGSPRMTDEAIIALCLERLRGVPPDRRGAQFRTAFAIAAPAANGSAPPVDYFSGTLRGVILEQPDPLRIEGYPFESIFFVPQWNRLLGSIHHLPAAQRAGYVTHREQALRAALPRLRQMLGA